MKISSVILPVYNEEDVITEVLKKNVNAFENGNANIREVIIVDDGSIDNSKEKIKNFIRNYKGKINIRLVPHTTNMGKAQALNTGIRNARGDFVLLTDSDSYMDTKTPERVLREMMETDAACVVGKVMPIQKTLLARLQGIEYAFDQKIIRAVQSLYTNVLSIPGPLYFIKKDFVKKVKFDANSIVEDFKIGIELNKRKKKIIPTDNVVYSYVPTSLSQLRKQRLRWFGGILKETLKNRPVWKANPFYLFNILMCFTSFIFTTSTIILLGLMIYFATNLANLLINFSLFFIIFCFTISVMYVLVTKKFELDTFLIFPLYLTFLFVIRTEVVIKVVLKRKFKWGTKEYR